jgi:hypothetical protein
LIMVNTHYASWNLMMNKSFMRSLIWQAILFAGLLIALEQPATADQVLSIPLNNAERLRLKGTAKDVIIANPAVADVTLVTPNQLVVIGKQAGRTTLLILDEKQQVLLNSMVVVSDGNNGLVTVHAPRGSRIGQDSYACAQNCTLIQDANSTVSSAGGGESNDGSATATDDAAAPASAAVTKVDTKIKYKISPNGVVTGTRTDVPTYGTPAQ